MDIAELKTYPEKNLQVDSGFRRRQDPDARSFFIIPAKAKIQMN
jgi:hypothetical protein